MNQELEYLENKIKSLIDACNELYSENKRLESVVESQLAENQRLRAHVRDISERLSNLISALPDTSNSNKVIKNGQENRNRSDD